MNQYQKHIKEMLVEKKYDGVNSLIQSNLVMVHDGKIKITKNIAKKLTLQTIINIGFNYTSCLRKIPASNELNDMLIDFLLNFKLDKQYKKPTMKQMATIFQAFTSQSQGQSFHILWNELGFGKQDIIKSYGKIGMYIWMNMTWLLSGSQRLKDDEIRKLLKGEANDVLRLINKYTDKEVEQMKELYGNYDVERKMEKTPKKFPARFLFEHVLDKIPQTCGWRSPDWYGCMRYLWESKSPYDIGTIVKHFCSNRYWYKNGLFESSEPDTKLETFLQLINGKDEKFKLDAVRKYYKIS